MEALSVRGHGSISSGSVSSVSQSLARDLSVRSDNLAGGGQHNRVLSFTGGPTSTKLHREMMKSARLAPGKFKHLVVVHVTSSLKKVRSVVEPQCCWEMMKDQVVSLFTIA